MVVMWDIYVWLLGCVGYFCGDVLLDLGDCIGWGWGVEWFLCWWIVVGYMCVIWVYAGI